MRKKNTVTWLFQLVLAACIGSIITLGVIAITNITNANKQTENMHTPSRLQACLNASVAEYNANWSSDCAGLNIHSTTPHCTLPMNDAEVRNQQLEQKRNLCYEQYSQTTP